MKNIKYLIFAFTGSLFLSCDTEEFLNPVPDSVVTVDSFFQTDADVFSGLMGIYDAIQGVNDATNSNEATTNRGVQFEHLLTEHRTDNTRNATTEGSKADFHRYLVNANNVEVEDYYASMYEVIFRANNVLNFIDIADTGNQARYTAEAKFLRAYAYFKLVRLFSDVPLVTEVVSPDDKETPFIRTPESEIYAQIIADLQEAISVLDNSNVIRASRAAAQGILAKVYLTQDNPNYTGARQLCEDIVNSGNFSLEPDFNDVFYSGTEEEYDASANSEVIFAIQYISGNQLESQGFSAEFTSSTRVGAEDGQNIVNDNLIVDFAAAGGDRTALSYVTFGLSNEVIKFLPEGSDITTVPPTYGAGRDAGNDYIALRYADVLLMHVEAIMAGGASTNDTAALASFQMVRDRAGLTDTVTSITQDDLLLERRVELAFENQRWFDLLRFGVADAVLSAHAIEMDYVFDARKLLLPIPASEINISGGLLTQNPGY
nr:RagB/SusD family nutrient uptake outer membrane protein [uncultured Allomuricauda sp.]